MEEPAWQQQVRKHLILTRRIRALDPRKDSSEFAEGRLQDYCARIQELQDLQNHVEDPQGILSGAIAVSIRIMRNKVAQFKLPIVFGDSGGPGEFDLGEGGFPVPVHVGPYSLSGSGSRTFAEAEEWNDW